MLRDGGSRFAFVVFFTFASWAEVDVGKDGGPAVDILALLDGDLRVEAGRDVEFGGGTEFDNADALTTLDDSACADSAADGSGAKSCDLADGCDGVASDGVCQDDKVGLIDLSGLRIEDVKVFTGFMGDRCHHAVDRRAVDVDIKDTEEDANTGSRAVEGFEEFDFMDG